MSIEARTAFDRLLDGGTTEAAPVPVVPEESDEARVIRQNREAVASWAGLGVPVTT